MTKRATGVYAIVGSDSYLAEQAAERLLERAVGREGRSESVQSVRGDETSWSRLLDLARTGSLFAERRAILVRGADALRGADDGLAEYLEDPTPGLSLILLVAKPDKRKGAWKRVLDAAEVVPAELGELALLQPGDVQAVDPHGAGGGSQQAADRREEGSLAGAGGAHDEDEFAAADAEVDAINGPDSGSP